ncbi:MAG: ABC transporter substrate-binding protein [Desulfobacteraceae bacterium]|nr:ABC transporter substrate-binding protein [Desulfobacteraceae bacterium]
MNRSKRRIVIFLWVLFISVGCSAKDPVRIGFVGGITGRVADLGIAGRDGVILAVEEKNAHGGINGSAIELIIKDDEQQSDIAVKVDRELIEAGVCAIIGHMTSAMSVAGVPIANENKILLISPTTSTNALSGLDDYFYRVFPNSAQTSTLLADKVFNRFGLRRVSAVIDITNREHTESAFDAFRDRFEALGGKITAVDTFLSGPDISFMKMAEAVVSRNADCIYILANALDSAMLLQQLHKLGSNTQVVSSDWSATDELVHFGGSAAEGLFFMHTLDANSTAPRYLAFSQNFYDRFGRKPGFAACHAYDAAQILFAALEKDPDAAVIRETIHDIGTFNGLQGLIRFDESGDVIRDHFPVRVKNGLFISGE